MVVAQLVYLYVYIWTLLLLLVLLRNCNLYQMEFMLNEKNKRLINFDNFKLKIHKIQQNKVK